MTQPNFRALSFAKTAVFHFPNNATVDDLAELRARVSAALEMGATYIILDFEPAGYVSSNAVGQTVALHRDVVAAGGELILCAMDPSTRLRMTEAKLDHFVEHVADCAAAWDLAREKMREPVTLTQSETQ